MGKSFYSPEYEYEDIQIVGWYNKQLNVFFSASIVE